MIRPMEEKDLPEVLKIEQNSFASPWGRWAFLVELKPPGYCFVYEKEGNIVGYLVLRIIKDEAHLMNFAVHPEWRRKKIGTQLLQFGINFCRNKGVKSVWLEVRANNLPALSLYQKMGFQTRGIRRGYYQDTGEDALLMELLLEEENERG